MKTYRAMVSSNGRIVIPAPCRQALGMAPGTELVLIPDEGELRLIPPALAVRRAQTILRRYVEKGRRLSRELIAERRREARRE